jgi:hypothetical protein
MQSAAPEVNPINIVYFLWINEKKNYTKIFLGQLQELAECGIMEISKLYIVISCANHEITEEVTSLASEYMSKYAFKIETHRENYYEYHGIKKLWELSHVEPDKVYLYFHAKGMKDAYSNDNSRHRYEKYLTSATLSCYRNAINLFRQNDRLMKIGLFPSRHHLPNDFIWMNFFYARGSYLATCDKPIIKSNRFYYETWSGTGFPRDEDTVYSLHSNNFQKYELNEVGNILNTLS